MLTLLQRQFSYRVLCGRKMPPIDSRLVCVRPGDAKGSQQGAEFQALRLFPGAHHIGKLPPRVLVERMPEDGVIQVILLC